MLSVPGAAREIPIVRYVPWVERPSRGNLSEGLDQIPEVFTQRAASSHSASDCALSQIHPPPPLTALLALLGLWVHALT